MNKSLMTSSPPVNTPQKKPRRASAETRANRLSAADTPKKFQDTTPLNVAALTPKSRGRPRGSRNLKGRKKSDKYEMDEI